MTETPVQQDVVDILTTDHHEVIDLLQQIKISTDAEERRDLTDTVISELVRHSVAEEMYVYPAMKKYLPDGEQAVDHDVEEHKELEKTMKELESVDAQSSDFTQLLGDLEDILHDHVRDEEKRAVPTAAGTGATGGTDRNRREGGECEETRADPAASCGAEQ